ncbi:MAG TPA: radical SAM protein, partial [Chloroflexi bacterium]|nr:radical SAM protein [Chloroflexota bacterium]
TRLQEIERSFTLDGRITPRFIWFEINSSQCNERCVHCYVENAQSGLPFADSFPKLSASDWKRVIAESADLGFVRAQFIGGEPFMWQGEQGEDVLDLAEWAISKKFKFIEIFTNGTLLTKKNVKRIAELKIRVAVSLYSIDPWTHDNCSLTI